MCLYVNLVLSFFQLLSHEDLQRGMPLFYYTNLIVLLACHFPHCPVINLGFFLPFSVCMFLEDSTVGRKVWRKYHMSLLSKVSELLGAALQQEALRDGPLSYTAVKVNGEQHQSFIRGYFIIRKISFAATLSFFLYRCVCKHTSCYLMRWLLLCGMKRTALLSCRRSCRFWWTYSLGRFVIQQNNIDAAAVS